MPNKKKASKKKTNAKVPYLGAGIAAMAAKRTLTAKQLREKQLEKIMGKKRKKIR